MNPHRTRRSASRPSRRSPSPPRASSRRSPSRRPQLAPASSAGAGKTIAVITPDYATQPAAKEAIDRFQAAAEAQGYQVTVVDTNSDNAAINGEITTAVAQDVDAIVTAFGTPQEFGEGLAAAGAAGVPVFGLDTGGVVEPTLANVTTDNALPGRVHPHRRIIDALGGQARSSMIRLRPVRAGPSPRRGGTRRCSRRTASRSSSTSRATRPTRPASRRRPRSTSCRSTRRGEVDAVWAGWDASALGAYQATQEAGRTEVLVTGVDGQDFAQAEVAKGGNWIATVRQDWPTIATTLVGIINDHFAGTDPAEPVVYRARGAHHGRERGTVTAPVDASGPRP